MTPNPAPNRLIFQVALGELGESPLYQSCIGSVRSYAKSIGVEHRVLREPILKISPSSKESNRSPEVHTRHGGYLPVFEKENAFDLLDEFDEILVIDADVNVSPGSPNVFEEVPKGFDFAAVVERDMPLNGPYRNKIRSYSISQYLPLPEINWNWSSQLGAEFFNMGVFVVRNSFLRFFEGLTAIQWLQREEFVDFVNGRGPWKWSTDQTLLNYWIRATETRTAKLDWRWNCLMGAVAPRRAEEAFFRHFFLGGDFGTKKSRGWFNKKFGLPFRKN